MLEALARALQLDDAERAHLFDLARTAGPLAKRRRRSAPKQIRPSVQRLLDAITAAPALVQNGRLDILAANQLARGLYSEANASISTSAGTSTSATALGVGAVFAIAR